MLEDGTYDALVFDADDVPGGDEGSGGIAVDLTILSGPHKGEVVSISSTEWSGDALDLLGIPATITVTDGTPSVVFEP